MAPNLMVLSISIVFTCAVSSFSLSMPRPCLCRPLALTERSCLRLLMSSWTLEMALDDILLMSSWTCFWSLTNFLSKKRNKNDWKLLKQYIATVQLRSCRGMILWYFQTFFLQHTHFYMNNLHINTYWKFSTSWQMTGGRFSSFRALLSLRERKRVCFNNYKQISHSWSSLN